MTQLKPYPEYKNTGLEWIPQIPKGWRTTKLKYALQSLNHKRIPLSGEVRSRMKKSYDYYGASGIIDKVDDYIFDEELILIGEDGANLYSRSSPLAFLASGKYWVNNHAHILKPRQGNNVYFVNLLESIDYTIYISGSAQPKLTQDALSNITIIEPPIDEQYLIAQYIEKKIIEIDLLISDKERLINLLEEKRQALITEKVTKGLDPNVKMKDSGIEWVGKIPEHWAIIKIKYLFNVKNGGTPKSNTSSYWDDKGMIWITPEDLSSDGYYISNSKRKISSEGLENSSATLISKNSIVLSTRAPIGNIKFVIKEYTTNQGCKSLEKSTDNINELYYFYLLKNNKTMLQSMGRGTTFLELSNRDLSNLKIPVLPLKEMNKIVEVISTINQRVDSLIESQKSAMKLLKEYRESLIYEAVTGKIDLRDYEADAGYNAYEQVAETDAVYKE